VRSSRSGGKLMCVAGDPNGIESHGEPRAFIIENMVPCLVFFADEQPVAPSVSPSS